MLQPSEIARPTCDFCSSKPGAYRYPATTLIAAGLSTPKYRQQSVGDWAACPVCHGLIQKDDRAGLADRALDFLLSKYHGIAKNEADELYQELFVLFGQFYDNRCGEPTFAVSTEGTVRNEPAEKPMTKTQIVQALADECGITRKAARNLLDTLAQTAATEVKKNGVFVVPGIGRLVRVDRKARTGRNRAGEPTKSPRRRL